MDAIGAFFTNLVTSATRIAVPLAMFMLLIAAVIIMTSGGNSRQMEVGKKAALASLGGFAIAMTVRLIVTGFQAALPS